MIDPSDLAKENTNDLIAALQDPVAKELFQRVFAAILTEFGSLHAALKKLHDEQHGVTRL